MTELSPFSQRVIDVIRRIPEGRVATYQQVAALSGKEHASRAVSWILNSCSEKYRLPWHRVISSKGKIAFKHGSKNYLLQKRLLAKESVSVGSNGEIDLCRYQYKKKAKASRRRNQPRMFG